jgi:hypothetical protein
MADTNGLDFFNLGEPLQGISGKVDTCGFDYFNLGEPFATIITLGETPQPPEDTPLLYRLFDRDFFTTIDLRNFANVLEARRLSFKMFDREFDVTLLTRLED